MLVLCIATAIVTSFLVEFLLHRFRNNYEIEWVCLSRAGETDMAWEIAKAMRKSGHESERQMNKAFKVASDGGW